MRTIILITQLYVVYRVIAEVATHYCSQISYPVFEYHFCSYSYYGQEVRGQCKSFEQCPAAIDLWKNKGFHPVTCWYNRFDHMVCCPDEIPLNHSQNNKSTTTTSPRNFIPPLMRTTTAPISSSKINTTETQPTNKILSSNRRRPKILMTSSNTTTSSTTISSTTTPSSTSTTVVTTPKILNINDECPVANYSINGTCKEYLECPSAIKFWRNDRFNPTLCQPYTSIVCCLEDRTDMLEAARSRRLKRSETFCESIYGPRFGVQGYAAGIPAKPMEFPYMVGLGWALELDNSTSFRCGGVLISDKFILTAAHCTSSRGQPPVRVKIGGDNLTDTTISEMNISQIYVHPMYNSSTRTNDIALIRMEGWFRKEFACLWNERNLEMNNLTALGYGNIRFAGPSSDQLIKAFLFSVPTSECQTSYDEQLLDTHMCAGNSKNDTCQGDSGGPLLMYRDSKFYPYVVGITSFGNPCGGNSPGVYTRVSQFIDWIEDIVWP